MKSAAPHLLLLSILLGSCGGGGGGERTCQSILQCRSGESCIDGLCVPTPTGKDTDVGTTLSDGDSGGTVECIVDGDCAALGDRYTCDEGSCIQAPCSCEPDAACTPNSPECWACTQDGECDDGDPCTTDACEEHECAFAAIADCCDEDDDCIDDDPCTVDRCADYRCQFQRLPGCCTADGDCDDGDACTVDACTDNTCNHESLGDECCDSDDDCDDGDVCTTDACRQSRCVHPRTSDEPRCGCVAYGDMCDDNNPCTVESCDEFTKFCSYEASDNPPAGVRCCTSAADCDDSDPSTEDRCINYTCVYEDRRPCEGQEDCIDAFPCFSSVCFESYCNQGQAIAGCCVKSSDCDDGDTCTVDVCGGSGMCQNTFQVGPGCCNNDSDCDDGLDCSQDYCCSSSGGCCGGTGGGPVCVAMNHCYHFVEVGSDCCATDVECDDDFPCTLDICEGGDCLNLLVTDACCDTDAECDDADPCTEDACLSGECSNGPIPGCCQSDTDCDDGNRCTEDVCTEASCRYTYIDGCCLDALDCNDDDVCTNDACSDEGVCVHEPFSPCCTADSDCLSSDICRVGECLDEVCVYSALPGCCHTASECDDGDPCTYDECMANNCHRTTVDSPECCQAVFLFDDGGFEDFGTLSFEFEGWEQVASAPPIGWKVVHGGQANSPSHALFYGNNVGQTYAAGFAHQGYALSPSLSLTDAESIFATFWVYLDFGGEEYLSTSFEVSVVASGAETTLWSADAFLGETAPDFRFIEIDLTPWRNQTVRLKFHFATTWPETTGGEGVYVDDLVVGSGCTESPVDCQVDYDCADNDPCTIERCVDQSCEVSVGDDPTCCAPRSFAATFDDGTLQGLSTGLLDGASPRFQWVTSAFRSATAPYALYFGDPSLSCEDEEGLCPAYGDADLSGSEWPGGTADFGPVDLTNMEGPILSFDFWGQIEPTFALDDLRVLVLQPPFEPGLERATEVWSAVSSGLMTVNEDSQKLETGGFVPVAIDLSPFAPGNIKLRFLFDSSESGYGYAEGVYIDNVTVGTDCR